MADQSSRLNSSSHRQFTVVINPSNGPGDSSGPGDDYIPAIQTLNAYPNVQMIGYVPTGYATRNITSVLQDVSTYANWSTTAANISMHGIFFDEIPWAYSSEHVEYLSIINDAVKSSDGMQSSKLIVHNPGAVPDAAMVLNSTDIVVAFEDSYDAWEAKRASLEALPLDRQRYSFMVHSVPTAVGLRSLIAEMSKNAAHLFATELTRDYYNTFGAEWRSFVNSVPAW